jgi:hypothetical protein
VSYQPLGEPDAAALGLGEADAECLAAAFEAPSVTLISTPSTPGGSALVRWVDMGLLSRNGGLLATLSSGDSFFDVAGQTPVQDLISLAPKPSQVVSIANYAAGRAGAPGAAVAAPTATPWNPWRLSPSCWPRTSW